MSTSLVLSALAASFITYTDPARTPSRVEAQIDRGPIVELILRCRGGGTAIISYSKVERLYCGPRGGCGPQLAPIVGRTCS